MFYTEGTVFLQLFAGKDLHNFEIVTAVHSTDIPHYDLVVVGSSCKRAFSDVNQNIVYKIVFLIPLKQQEQISEIVVGFSSVTRNQWK